VQGKTLSFRDAQVSDAGFILSLRTDSEKSRYLSAVRSDISAQEAWLVNYVEQADQAYFIIEHENDPIGTVRLYDPQGESFCWGSWILANTRPSYAAMESALMVYSYAVDHLGFTAAHFDVRKGNERVWRFHERFGAKRFDETGLDYFYRLNLPEIEAARNKYKRFLEQSVTVTFL
jgi:RimJ/RimL family protein N-acetyltransferase